MARKAGADHCERTESLVATSVMRWLVRFTNYVINRIITPSWRARFGIGQ